MFLNLLMTDLRGGDAKAFANFTRLSPDLFFFLLDRIGPQITKKDTNWRKALKPELKLAITLRYLATGDSYKSLAYGFRVANNTISVFIPEVCQALIDHLSDEFMELPQEPEQWLDIAEQFYLKWNLPHCIGALDGKHVAIKCPKKSGSLYYNYKQFFSIVLMALVDANYRFIYINVGAPGAGSDGGVFANTMLKTLIEDNALGLPPPEPLTGCTSDLPYFIVADEAFALKPWLMKPYPRRNMAIEQRIYNYRISRGRRVVENAFGILAARFRCLLGTMPQSPERVTKVVIAICILHNILRHQRGRADPAAVDREDPITHDVIPGEWRQNERHLPDLGQAPTTGHAAGKRAKAVRQYLQDWFNGPGSVPWQLEKA